jgi:ubiquinone/menaquinone biosynthesis C-methylase UbiE
VNLNIYTDKAITLESQVIGMLRQVGVQRGQTVLDFGCGYGAYTIPVAEIIGEHGIVYALDKDKGALDELMRKAESGGLKNIVRMETSGELEIDIADESVDIVLMFNVFHSFYFPKTEDRRRLLGEIHRIMKSSAILLVTAWPNLIEPENEDDVENADFNLEKEISRKPTDSKELETPTVLLFRKTRYIPALNKLLIRR